MRRLDSRRYIARIRRRRTERSCYTLIDPNPDICGRYAAIVGTSMNFHQAYFSEDHLDILFEPQACETEEPPKVFKWLEEDELN